MANQGNTEARQNQEHAETLEDQGRSSAPGVYFKCKKRWVTHNEPNPIVGMFSISCESTPDDPSNAGPTSVPTEGSD